MASILCFVQYHMDYDMLHEYTCIEYTHTYICNSYTMAICGVWIIHARDPRASACINPYSANAIV